MPASALHIVAPRLFSPPADLPDRAGLRPPGLEKLLDGSRRHPGEAGYEVQLRRLCGLPAETPAAPCALLGENLADADLPGDAIWMLATPVHLKADLHNLLLFPGNQLEIGEEEATALADAFNAHFGDRGMTLVTPCPQRWYLRLEHLPRLDAAPLEAVAGRSPADHLPRGEDAPAWRAILTEVQMLFHAHPANRRREAAGLPPINALWIRGPGRLPVLDRSELPFQGVAGDEVTGLGMARLAGAHPKPWAEPVAEGELRLFDRFRQAPDGLAWGEALADFEGWLAQALAWAGERRGRSIRLYPCNGEQFHFDGPRLARFWRRSRPFPLYLER